MLSTFISKLVRKKHVTLEDTELPRVLNLFDLTLMGIGSTIGIGFYVLAGQVARNIAGPAVVVCFLIAGFASIFSGLCYAEFGARVPKAGSAYVYSFVCVGEFVAFVIGWNLVLEYVIGTSSVAKGYSNYIDELANNTMSKALTEVMPIDVEFLDTFPDFLAFGICFLIAIALALGVKESTMFNNICTAINLVVVVYTIIAAATQADPYNWRIPADALNETCTEPRGDDLTWGTGGFAPYGFNGIMQGAATCFFGFVGFDCIATTGEEALRPARNIPLSISISLLFIFVAYFGMGATLTLAVPYCMQNAEAPLVDFFEELGWEVSKWFVSIGALFGFSASLFGVLLPLPRILYAMAEDGILFRFLGRIHKRFRTPAIATLLSGLFAGAMAMVFKLDALVDMMSIGTLLAYTIVALSVMLLRYGVEDDIVLKEPSEIAESGDLNSVLKEANETTENGHFREPGVQKNIVREDTFVVFSFRSYMNQLFNTQRLVEPTHLTSSLVNYATIVYCFTCALVVLIFVLLGKELSEGNGGAITALVIACIIAFVNILVIARQPQSSKVLAFKVPFVPWLPALSSLINLYLMFNLSTDTWIRFGVWMGIGLPLYFIYGMGHSRADEWKSKYKQSIDNPAGPSDAGEENTEVIKHNNLPVEVAGNQENLSSNPRLSGDEVSSERKEGATLDVDGSTAHYASLASDSTVKEDIPNDAPNDDFPTRNSTLNEEDLSEDVVDRGEIGKSIAQCKALESSGHYSTESEINDIADGTQETFHPKNGVEETQDISTNSRGAIKTNEHVHNQQSIDTENEAYNREDSSSTVDLSFTPSPSDTEEDIRQKLDMTDQVVTENGQNKVDNKDTNGYSSSMPSTKSGTEVENSDKQSISKKDSEDETSTVSDTSLKEESRETSAMDSSVKKDSKEMVDSISTTKDHSSVTTSDSDISMKLPV